MNNCLLCGKSFSKFYDIIWENDSYDYSYFQYIEKCIHNYKPDSKSILELAVGTGKIIGFFSLKNFDLYGLDISEDFLKKCKKKIPDITLYLQNMTNFKINLKFDVIFLVFDSINYLMDFSEWETLFKNLKLHLNSNGLFIFNTYSEKALNLFKNDNNYSVFKFSKDFVMIEKANVKEDVLEWEVNIFERSEGLKYEFHKFLTSERIFKIQKIKKTLGQFFNIIEIVDECMLIDSITEKTKYMFLCRKI